MYNIHTEDVLRFTNLIRRARDVQDWDGYYDNLYDQMGPTEYMIQNWWAEKIDLLGKDVYNLNSGLGFFTVPFSIEKGAKSITTVDMCPITQELALEMNENYINYNHIMADVTFDNEEIFPKKKIKNTVYINTSCEHSYMMKEVIPTGVEVVLSSNNLTKRGHINKVNSIQELVRQADLKEVFFTDERVFEHVDELGLRNYTQFFVHGKR